LDIAQFIMSFLEESRPLVNTETGGLTHCDAGSANVDFFFQAVPQEEPKENTQIRRLLDAAWHESPDICLRQIFHLGASREGKQDRYSFYDAMLWLWQNQPATVLGNLHLVPQTNYWKGLLELLARVCEGPQRSLERDVVMHNAFIGKTRKLLSVNSPARSKQGPLKKSKKPTGWRPGSRLELAAEALKRYDSDPLYRALFERIGQLFAKQLRADLDKMRKGKQISCCAKWCPLLYHSFDRRTLICEGIGRWLFPADLPEFDGLTEREYSFRARDKLRKSLSELKEYMKSPERLMCQQRWEEIEYKRVPGTCMQIHSTIFEAHDQKRFGEYLEQLCNKEVKANTGALQPHELLRTAMYRPSLGSGDSAKQVVAQAQWKELVDKTRRHGALQDCIAVCDVSGSMTCRAAGDVSCMDIAISMSLLLAEASGAREVITFETVPRLAKLPATQKLSELGRFAQSLPWGGSTNFYRIFDLLLSRQGPLPQRIFVFSDMQFSSAGGRETDMQRARERYAALGVPLPQLVFWNLRSTTGAPALANDSGIALVSGFSPLLLKSLMQSGSLNPLQVLSKELDTPLLRKPRVIRDASEAKRLLSGPQIPAHSWASEKPREGLDALPAIEVPWAEQSQNLGMLEDKEVIAAFLGKKGQTVQALRKELLTALHAWARGMKISGGLSLWLDVVTQIEPAPVLESGMVQATVRARANPEVLTASLQAAALRSIVAQSIKMAISRAHSRKSVPEGSEPRDMSPAPAGSMSSESSVDWL
jgi:hypothetical protein